MTEEAIFGRSVAGGRLGFLASSINVAERELFAALVVKARADSPTAERAAAKQLGVVKTTLATLYSLARKNGYGALASRASDLSTRCK